MLEEFPNGGGFPAPTWFGARSQLGNQQRIMLLHVLGHRRPGADKGKAAAELIRKKGVIERLGERKYLAQKQFDLLRPGCFVIAARDSGKERFSIREPGGAQPMELSASDLQALARGRCIHRSAVKEAQYLLQELCADSLG